MPAITNVAVVTREVSLVGEMLSEHQPGIRQTFVGEIRVALNNLANRFDMFRIGFLLDYLRQRCHRSVDAMVQAFQPPHSANRHDAGCRGAGAGGLGDRGISQTHSYVALPAKMRWISAITAAASSASGTVVLSVVDKSLIWHSPAANSRSPAIRATRNFLRSAYWSCLPSFAGSG